MKTIKENLYTFYDATYDTMSIRSLNQYIKFYNDGSVGIAIDIYRYMLKE